MSIPQLKIPYAETLDGLLGHEIIERSSELMRSRIYVHKHHWQPFGLVHGGVYAAMAETLASLGTMYALASESKLAPGISNCTNFLRPITNGYIHAVARPRHRGRTTWVWDIELSND